MDRTEAWTAIDGHRRDLVALLEDLSPDEWERPSLCGGWTVRQAAAHVALQNTRWRDVPRALAEVARHGGMDGAIRAAACRHAELPVDAVIGEIRDRIGVHRSLPFVSWRGTAIDYLVHGQDIAVPLGRALPVPARLAALAADEVWSNGRMFHARTRFAGFRLVADDADWAAGAGQEVRGPVGGLLLLLTGRTAALAQLTGPGADALRARPTPSAR